MKNNFESLINPLKEGYLNGLGALADRITFFLIFSAIGHIWGQSELGRISTIFNFVNILLMANDLGLTVYFQKESSHRKDIWALFNIGLNSKILFSIITLLIVPVYAHLINKISYILFFEYYFIMLLFSFSNLYLSTILGRQNNFQYLRIICYSRLLMILTLLFIVFSGNNQLIILTFLSGGVVQFYLAYKIANIPRYKWVNLRHILLLLRRTYPIWLGLLFVFIYDKIDILILTAFKNLSNTGNYFAAYSISKSFTIVSSFYLVNYFSRFSKYYKTDFNKFKNDVKNSIIISLISAFVIIMVFQIFSDVIIKVLFGSKFINASALLRILSFSIIFMLLNYNFGTILNSIEKEKIPMFGGAIALFVNIFCNIIFIPRYGEYAAAYITILTEVSMFLFLSFNLARIKIEGGI